jgi:transposase
VIDYEDWCRIRQHIDRQGLTVAQTARALGLHPHTVAKWAALEQYRPRAAAPPRPSKLDPFKPLVVRWLDSHPYSAQQVWQRLREAGFQGGASIVKDYVARIRPRHARAFLKLDFAPGECAQLDWGQWGTIGVGATTRRLSFFVMVLCYSRRMYLEFTVSQQMEFFLACHENAFAAFGGVPQRLMVDNLKSAVLGHLVGQAPVFNPTYLDFARHWGFEISACNPRSGNEKGRVENAVGYVKKNLLAGLELPEFAALGAAARLWVDTVADRRLHASTHERPIERFAAERDHLLPLAERGFDLGRITSVRVNRQARVALESNTYSVPPHLVGQRLLLKAYPERLCLYHRDQLVAAHARCFDRHRDIEDPVHVRQLLSQRASAREQRLMVDFLALSPRAAAYAEGLSAKRLNARGHIRKILALAELHGREPVERAIDDALDLEAFSAEYIAHLLAARRPIGQPPSALQLTRRVDLLELDMPAPDLSVYERHNPRRP